MSEKIVISNADFPENYLDIGLFFPSLVICLRDFSVEITEETADEYFEKCLIEDEKGNNGKTKKYNEIRHSISSLFRRRTCFTFDRPTSDRKKLKKLEEVEESDLTEDFREETEQFLKYMYSCKPKELMDGSLLNGRSKLVYFPFWKNCKSLAKYLNNEYTTDKEEHHHFLQVNQ